MNLLQVREQLRLGKPLTQLPLRVTFYARVSTDKAEQLGSLSNQVQYYTDLIAATPCWDYVPGYVDEGLSGTGVRRREAFLQMIRDAKAGRFDFILTKEISRFSRSTLDSIRFTQELLEHQVGVLFQNDGINTLDPDSELRLVIMSGVAQDEVRKLSQRLHFGFQQAIKNGHILGNDRLWGYRKQGGVLTVDPEEAAVVRRIFHLYADQRLGLRRLSQALYQEGLTGRSGAPFHVGTLRSILENPKYKGWYCGNRTRTVDYRTKRRLALPEEEWVTYPDPRIPPIVSEQLWDRANALYRRRSAQARAHAAGADFQRRYPYSGKLRCGLCGAPYHRRLYRTAQGEAEGWLCRTYRNQGRGACPAPGVTSRELDQLLAQLLPRLGLNRAGLLQTGLALLRQARGCPPPSVPDDQALAAIEERLVELRLQGVLSLEEFQRRRQGLEERRRMRQAPPERADADGAWESGLRAALEVSPVLAALVEEITLLPGCDRTGLRLRVTPVAGAPVVAECLRERSSLRLVRFSRCAPPDGDCAR